MIISAWWLQTSNQLGAVHKIRPQLGGGGCPVRRFCEQERGGIFRCGLPLFSVKTPDFFEIYGVSAQTGEGGGG